MAGLVGRHNAGARAVLLSLFQQIFERFLNQSFERATFSLG